MPLVHNTTHIAYSRSLATEARKARTSTAVHVAISDWAARGGSTLSAAFRTSGPLALRRRALG
jgi:hypothetical protein